MAIAVVSPLPTEDADYNDVQGDMEFALQGWDSIVLKCGAKTGYEYEFLDLRLSLDLRLLLLKATLLGISKFS